MSAPLIGADDLEAMAAPRLAPRSRRHSRTPPGAEVIMFHAAWPPIALPPPRTMRRRRGGWGKLAAAIAVLMALLLIVVAVLFRLRHGG